MRTYYLAISLSITIFLFGCSDAISSRHVNVLPDDGVASIVLSPVIITGKRLTAAQKAEMKRQDDVAIARAQ